MDHYVVDFELISLFILIALGVYLFTRYSNENASNQEFKHLTTIVAAACLFDVLASVAIDNCWPVWAEMVLNTLYFAFAVAVPYVFTRYIGTYIYPDRKQWLKKQIPARIIYGLFDALLVANFFVTVFYRFDGPGVYVRGALYPVLLGAPLIFCAISIYLLLRHSSVFTKVQQRVLMATALSMPLSSSLEAIFYQDYLANFFVMMVLLFVILMSIETPDEQELAKVIKELEELHGVLETKVEEQTAIAESQTRHVTILTRQMMMALARIVDAKDHYTSGHSARVARYSRMIAEELGLPEEDCDVVYSLGILHDIGKVGVPESIINKPDKLDDNEYAVIRSHPQIGSDILAKVTLRPGLRTGARWHHERVDGKGYPDGLKGDEIPREARIISVADAYDAMTSYRSYRSVLPQEAVAEQIRLGRGTQFDEDCADAMLALMARDTGYRLREFREGEQP